RPQIIARPQILVPRISDELVFHEVALGGIGKVDGLVGNHAQLGYHAARRERDVGDQRVNFLRSFVFVRAPGDIEEAGAVVDPLRAHDGKPVLPDFLVRGNRRLPGLRRQVEYVSRVTFAGNGLDQLELVGGVGRVDVTIQRG